MASLVWAVSGTQGVACMITSEILTVACMDREATVCKPYVIDYITSMLGMIQILCDDFAEVHMSYGACIHSKVISEVVLNRKAYSHSQYPKISEVSGQAKRIVGLKMCRNRILLLRSRLTERD